MRAGCVSKGQAGVPMARGTSPSQPHVRHGVEVRACDARARRARQRACIGQAGIGQADNGHAASQVDACGAGAMKCMQKRMGGRDTCRCSRALASVGQAGQRRTSRLSASHMRTANV